MDGTYKTPACTATPPTFTFAFYWDSTLNQLWSTTVSTCTVSTLTYDTGPSPVVVPPGGANASGAHTVIVDVYTSSGPLAPNGSATAPYTVNQPPPPPPPSPRPSPRPPSPAPSPLPSPLPSTQPSASPSASPSCPPGAVTAGCPTPSPSNAACPASAINLPPSGSGGWADNLIAAAMVATALPIAGLALFGPGTLLAAARRRRRLLMLIGLSAMTALTLSCTTTAGPLTPTPAALISPSASPSCSA